MCAPLNKHYHDIKRGYYSKRFPVKIKIMGERTRNSHSILEQIYIRFILYSILEQTNRFNGHPLIHFF